MNAKTPRNGGASDKHPQSTPSLPHSTHVLADKDRHSSRLAYERAETADGRTAAAIIEVLTARGPLTDDALHAAYIKAGYQPRTPQRIRTVRAAMVRAGRVREAGRGRSLYGNPATIWAVNA